MYLDVKVAEVVFMWNSVDAWYSRVTRQRQSRMRFDMSKAYGSAINLSVSLMILFGRAMMCAIGRCCGD